MERLGKIPVHLLQNSIQLASGLIGSNGLWYNAKKQLLFVAMATGRSLSVYKFKEVRIATIRLSQKVKTGELLNDLPLMTGLDNLYEDEEGGPLV